MDNNYRIYVKFDRFYTQIKAATCFRSLYIPYIKNKEHMIDVLKVLINDKKRGFNSG